MLRLFFAVMLCGIWSPCFSEKIELDFKEWQIESLSHFFEGSINLLSHEPKLALEDFYIADTHLDTSDKSSFAMSFLILFGQTIA